MYLIFTVSIIHLIACLSPGPDIFLVVLNSLRRGWRSGLATTSGILCGVSIQISLCLGGVAYLLQQSTGIHFAMGIAGGAWLAYMGVRGIQHAKARQNGQKPEGKEAARSDSFATSWLEGFTVNILNPKALLYFLSLFTVMLGPQIPLSLRVTCGITMLTIQAIAFSCVALLVARPRFNTKWQSLQPILEWALSLILIILGILLWIRTILFHLG